MVLDVARQSNPAFHVDSIVYSGMKSRLLRLPLPKFQNLTAKIKLLGSGHTRSGLDSPSQGILSQRIFMNAQQSARFHNSVQ